MKLAMRFTAVILAGGALSCGGAEEAPKPSGSPMSGAAPQAAEPAAGQNRAPVVGRVALDPASPVAGGRVRAVVQASDPDGGSVRLRYAWTLEGKPVGGDQPELLLAQARKGQDVEVVVIASDGIADGAPARARAELGNRPPRMVAVGLDPIENLGVGDTVKAVPEGEDPDADPLRYEVEWLVNDRPVAGKGLELSTKGLRSGDRVAARVRATDGRVTTDPLTSGVVAIGNSAPRITSRPSTAFEEGEFRYDVEATDADGDSTRLRYSLVDAPAGMTIDRLDGTITWRPTKEQTGKHRVEVVVEDVEGAKFGQEFELTIAAAAGTETVPAAQAPPE